MKIFPLIVLIYLCSFSVNGQIDNFIPTIPSPNVAQFKMFDEVPVDHYTGIPNIQIPLYSIKGDNFDIPINVRYHSASNKVNTHPTWVGLGWDLTVGGVITRNVNGFMDEAIVYDPYSSDGYELGYLYNYSELDRSDWNDDNVLYDVFARFPGATYPPIDSAPDEFSFNFLGYSGKFYLNHKGEWQVISEDPIKIEFDNTIGNGLISNDQLRPRIRQIIPDDFKYDDFVYFNEFTLITPDGSRFIFGGPSATEYKKNVRNMIYPYLQPISWYLKKVITPVGDEYDIYYHNFDQAIYNMYKNYSGISAHRPDPDGPTKFYGIFFTNWWGIECFNSQIYRNDEEFSGDLIFPVYPRLLEFPEGFIRFDVSESNELRYLANDDEFLTLMSGFFDDNTQYIYPWYFPESDLSDPKIFEWHKLDAISIYNDKDNYPYTSPIKKINFEYVENNEERLKLSKIDFQGADYKSKETFQFGYNTNLLPQYGNYARDSWGYYNGQSENTGDIHDNRTPDSFYGKAELLTDIIYPNGGGVHFTFETNNFSAQHKKSNSGFSVTDTVGYGAGHRIGKISYYSNLNSSPSIVKEYEYKSNYSLTNTSGSSSGIVGTIPRYSFNIETLDAGGDEVNLFVISNNYAIAAGINANGGFVGYSEVAEIRKRYSDTEGYTKYTYSNFDTDLWGNDHLDVLGISTIPDARKFFPSTSNSLERGKLLKSITYNDSDVPLNETLYKYELHNFEPIRLINKFSFDICSYDQASAQMKAATAYEVLTDRYLLTEKYQKIIDEDLEKNKDVFLSYDNRLQLKSVTEKFEDKTLKSINYYPYDFNIFSDLVTQNIVRNPIKVQNYYNSNIINGLIMDYNSVGQPTDLYEYFSNTESEGPTHNPNVLLSENYEQRHSLKYYPNSKKLKEVNSFTGDTKVFLWGNNSRYNVAQIFGLSYAELENSTNESLISSTSFNETGINLSAIRADISNLPNVDMETFLIKPLIGVYQKEGPRGFNSRRIFYYDDYQRLRAIYTGTGTLLKQIQYKHYNTY